MDRKYFEPSETNGFILLLMSSEDNLTTNIISETKEHLIFLYLLLNFKIQIKHG